MSRIGPGRWLLVVLLLALVNLPVVLGLAADRRVATEGEEVTAQVVDSGERDGTYAVALEFDAAVDPSGRAWPVPVEESTYDEAQRTGRLEVTAVPGEAGAFEVPGEVRSTTGLWMTLLGNLLIAGWVALMARRTRRRAEPDDPDPGSEPAPG